MRFNRQTYPLGIVWGAPVNIHISWLPVFPIYTWVISSVYLPKQGLNLPWWQYWILGAVTTALLFYSILIHEIAHSAMARWEGLGTGEITLYMFGGLATLEGQPSQPSSEFKIAIAGPAASFTIGTIFFLLHYALFHGTTHFAAAQVFRHLGIVNWFLAGFNILPGLPLDGGRILRAVLWRFNRSFRESTRTAVRAGITISLALLLYGGYIFFQQDIVTGIWCVTIGLLLGLMLYSSEGRIFAAQRIRWGIVEEVMSQDVVMVPPGMKITEFIDRVLKNNRFTSFPVTLEHRLYGMLALEDLKKIPSEQWPHLTVQDVMRPVDDSMFINDTATIDEAKARLGNNSIGRAAVLNPSGLVVGYVSKSDLK